MAALALVGTQINAAAEEQVFLARHLGKAAVATLPPAAPGDAADEMGGVVRPYHDLAAVTLEVGIGLEDDIAVDERRQRVLDVRVLALIVSADEDGAAAVSAGGVNYRISSERDVLTQHLHRAAHIATYGRGIGLKSGSRSRSWHGCRCNAARFQVAGHGSRALGCLNRDEAAGLARIG